MSTSKRYMLAVFTILLVMPCISGCITGGDDSSDAPESIMVYCGAGMREPMDDIGVAFEEEYGITVEYNYAGSNALLSQMEITEQGDCYMPGATKYIETAMEKGFIASTQNICYHIPVITVPKGNPANIQCLADMGNEGVTLVWGDPQVAAIGSAGVKILQNNGLYDAVWPHVIATLPTMNEVMMQIAMGQADASMNWWDTVKFVEEIEVIQIPKEQNDIKIVPIGTLTFSEYPEAAQQFVDFVASEEGLQIFEEHGFIVYPNAEYEN
jgi:molybdate transport system substrate-binding protein